jgi:GWxTD domain-containing protein
MTDKGMRLAEGTKKMSWLAVAFLMLSLALSFSCRVNHVRKELSPDYAAFLSQVRYLITAKEEKAFLSLPDSEKDQFIAEFWRRRDSDPDTEANEFQTEYYSRIDQANHLFHGEGKEGWLTDRGRIYILFGPPMQRMTNPSASDSSGQCGEVWYYGDFPVVFRDAHCTGDYVLVTYDLTAMREVNIAYMHELSSAQAAAQALGPEISHREKDVFDFSFEVKTNVPDAGKVEGVATIAIPYAGIWFKHDAGVFKTEMEVRLELRDGGGKVIWEAKDIFEVVLKEAELKDKQKTSYIREIPLGFEKNIEELRRGKNTFRCRLKNLTGKEEIIKDAEAVF